MKRLIFTLLSFVAFSMLLVKAQLTITPSITAASCGSCMDGGIGLTVTGGTSPYIYNWSSGETGSLIYPKNPGVYKVTVWDNSYTLMEMDTFVIGPISTGSCGFVFDSSSSKPPMSGFPVGSINSQVIQGGVKPYTYNWSNLATDPNILNLVDGVYTVTVTDAVSCSQTVTYNLLLPPPCAVFKLVDSTFASETYTKDGSLTYQKIGGTSTGPFNFNWGDTMIVGNASRTNLKAGMYFVSISDQMGCSVNVYGSVYVKKGSDPIWFIPHVMNASSPFSSDGEAMVEFVNGGGSTEDYNYLWSNGNTSYTNYNLSPGSYWVTITNKLNSTKKVIKEFKVGYNSIPLSCNEIKADFYYSTFQDTITLTNMSMGGGIDLTWDMGDGNYLNDSINFKYAYTKDNVYPVKLTIYQKSSGCIDDTIVYIPIDITSDTTGYCMAKFSIGGYDSIIYISNTSLQDATSASKNATKYTWDFGDYTVSNFQYPGDHIFTEDGSYLVSLTMYDTISQCMSTFYQNAFIDIKSKSGSYTNASFDYINIDSTNKVNFYDYSTGNIKSWYWTFGDGTYNTGQYQSHTYDKPGYYTVCLSVSDSLSKAPSDYCKDIFVGTSTCMIAAKFDYFINGNTIQLTDKTTGKPNVWYWYLGDGNTSSSQDGSHTFTEPGYYLISLAVGDSLTNCYDYYYEWIKIGNQNCKADFNYTVDATTKKVTFDNKSILPKGYYNWWFDDGDYSVSESPTHIYNKSGLYNVYLTVVDSAYTCSDYKWETIQVGKVDCSAGFSTFVDPSDNTTYFTNDAIGDSINYYWIFGDGEAFSGIDPVHKYQFPGYYSVGLYTYNPLTGCMDYSEQSVLVGSMQNDCEAKFIYSVTDETKKLVKFTNKSLGTGLSYVWDFGDGQYSTDEDPVVDYSAGGYYDVCLLAINAAGTYNITCDVIKVAPDATDDCYANFDFFIDSVSKSVKVVDQSSGKPNKWFWDFGDGATATGSTASHTYATRGYYSIMLESENTSTGCISYQFNLVNVGGIDDYVCDFGYIEKDTLTKASGYPVDFVGIAHGDAAKLKWNFGDGGTDTTSLRPTHEYAAPGIYTACLIIEDQITGETDTTCNQVRVGQTGIKETKVLPSAISLNTYPNPVVNDNLTIEYSLQNDDLVDLAIINAQGVKIATIIRTTKSCGTYKIIWNSNTIPRGVYYIKLTTNSETITNEVIVQ